MKPGTYKIPSVADAIKHPTSYRVVYDSILGWGLEEVRDGMVLMVTEKHALWLIGYFKRTAFIPERTLP